LGGVSAQPVEVRTALERLVAGHAIERGVGVERAEDRIDGGRPRQHRRSDVGAVIQQVLLHRERAHGLPQEHARGAAAAGIDRVAGCYQVVYQRVPSVRAEVAELARVPRAASVTTMSVCVNLETGGAECGGQAPVTGGVLAQAMRDLHDGTPRTARGPVAYEQVDVATARNGEGLFGHVRKARAPAVRPPSLPVSRSRPRVRMASSLR